MRLRSALPLLLLAASAATLRADEVAAPAAPAAPATSGAAAASPAAAATATPSGMDVLRRSVTASGGTEKFAAIESLETKLRLEMPAQGLSGDVTLTQAKPNRMLAVTEFPGIGTLRQGYDGTTGWASDPLQGPRVLSGAELQDVQQQAEEVFILADVAAHYAKAENQGLVDFEGSKAWKVALETRRGRAMTSYFDPATGHQVGLEVTAQTALGAMPTVSVMSEHRDFGGIVMPAKVVQRVMGMEQVLTMVSLRTNLPQLPSFAPPPEVHELMAGRPAAATPGE